MFIFSQAGIRFSILVLVLLSVVSFSIDAQNDNECSATVTQALERVSTDCQNLGRNEICYGFFDVSATGFGDDPVADFEDPGDIVSVTEIQSIKTAQLDEQANRWGVAVLSLQANIPDSLPGQNVVFVVFGDTTIEAENTNHNSYDQPLQAFRLSSGIGVSQCEEAPRDGVLVQSPQDITVNFLVNGVEIAMGSTVFLSQSGEDPDYLQVTTIEGHAEVTANGETQLIEAGFSIEVKAGVEPETPATFNREEVALLPTSTLPEAVEIPIILTASEATSAWIDSGITIEAGKTYQIRATGSTNLWPQCSEFCPENEEFSCEALCAAIEGGPAGTVPVTSIVPSSDPFMVFPGESFLVLLGRIDADGDPFVVGDNYTFEATADGQLFFRINEDTRTAGDEPGAYAVTIKQVQDD